MNSMRARGQVLVISDEVYKYMVYSNLGIDGEEPRTSSHHGEPTGAGAGAGGLVTDGGTGSSAGAVRQGRRPPLPPLRHIHFATLDGMWDRTITISSAGKTFSVTGWQVRELHERRRVGASGVEAARWVAVAGLR